MSEATGALNHAECTNPQAESCSDAGCPAHGGACPDCGRGDCTGEDCYWPEEAGLRPGDEGYDDAPRSLPCG